MLKKLLFSIGLALVIISSIVGVQMRKNYNSSKKRQTAGNGNSLKEEEASNKVQKNSKETKRPNILLIFPDQHRGDWMPYSEEIFRKEFGMDKLPIRMPNIENLMENGVTFTKAVSSSPVCAPARACLASGRRYESCGVSSNKVNFPLDQKTFYSVLKENGYSVGGVGKFDLHKPVFWWGLDGWIDDLGTLGFTHAIDNAGKSATTKSVFQVEPIGQPKDPYMKYLFDNGLMEKYVDGKRASDKFGSEITELPEEAYQDNWVGNNGINMIREFAQDQPWFLQVNFPSPHTPFIVTKRMREAWKDVTFPIPNQWDNSMNDVNSARQNYAALLENIDRNIGLMLDEIKRRGELDNTIIIYSSDHGEMLGDLGLLGKSKPIRGSVHVPLVISGPGMQKGVYSDALVETQDLAGTIVEYAGVGMKEAVDAISLKPLLEGKTKEFRKYQYSALNSWQMVSNGKYKLIIEKGIPISLYNVQNDPWENNNIIDANANIVNELSEYANR